MKEADSLKAFNSFQSAVQTVLSFLHQKVGLQLWMFTRVDGQDWIVLEALDHGYGVKSGDVFSWSDSFCSRMIEGLGPRIAPNSTMVCAYANAPIADLVSIKSYIGVPICNPDGSLFGTLCAIDPEVQPESIKENKELIELQSRLLTTILHYELQAQESARRCREAQAEAQLDILTGLYNRNGWQKMLELEEQRYRQYGQSAAIIVVDLDDFKLVNDTHGHNRGDRLLQTTANCLRYTVRQEDIVARLGGDEFTILMVNVTETETEAIAIRIKQKLNQFKIKASLGWGMRPRQGTMNDAFDLADQRMYHQKSQQKKEGWIEFNI